MVNQCSTPPENDAVKFRFLADAALAAGAVAAAVIPADKITVEDRVRLKCRSGCPSYGKYLTCPPYAMTADEFRACLREYKYALIVKFRSAAALDENVRLCVLRSRYDPGADPEQKENVARFIRNSSEHNRTLNMLMLDLEKTAFNAGFPFAVTTVCGTCGLCETCNIATGICNHPTMRRFVPEALGINVIKTAEDAGMPIRFPAPVHPERVAILLID
jgi:predicted metal-binding protein